MGDKSDMTTKKKLVTKSITKHNTTQSNKEAEPDSAKKPDDPIAAAINKCIAHISDIRFSIRNVIPQAVYLQTF